MSYIKDPDVRKAMETLETEIENYEDSIKRKDEDVEYLEEQVKKLQATNEELENDIAEKDERIKELEIALAEAYLTSEKDDGIQREDADVPP